MKKHLLAVVCSVALLATAGYAQPRKTKMAVKEAAPACVVSVAAKNATTDRFAQWIEKSELAATLKGAGPYTVFVPANEACDRLNADSSGGFNAENMNATLKAHIVEGNYDLTALLDNIRSNNWKGTLKTLDGGTLTLATDNGRIRITLDNGASALITTHNVAGGNGIIHVIDTVLAPK
jgi:uncharacterized surface protein with fasciclin (FAS1) repeats